MKSLVCAALLAATAMIAPAGAASDVVTLHAADGLHDGKNSWFEAQSSAFTEATGVKVQYIEAGCCSSCRARFPPFRWGWDCWSPSAKGPCC